MSDRERRFAKVGHRGVLGIGGQIKDLVGRAVTEASHRGDDQVFGFTKDDVLLEKSGYEASSVGDGVDVAVDVGKGSLRAMAVLGHTKDKGRAPGVGDADRASAGAGGGGGDGAIRPTWAAFTDGVNSVWVLRAYVAPDPGSAGAAVRCVTGFLACVGRGIDVVAAGREVGTGAEGRASGVRTGYCGG